MRPGTVVLTHGPLDPPDWWSGVAAELSATGHHVVAPEVLPSPPPYAVGWIAGAARPLHAAEPPSPLVLVCHGTAGPLLPALGRTQRAARRPIGGYVFVDATLPRQGHQTHLDLLRAADPEAADRLHDDLHDAEQSDRRPTQPLATDHDFWTEPLPAAVDWPDAPCGYIRTGAPAPAVGPTHWWARSAARRGWAVDDSGRDLGESLIDLIARLPG
jgi:hypothetical protein